MSREDPIKAEKDFSATLDEQFPLIEKVSDYKQQLEKYLVLEKQTRQSSDLASSKRVLNKIVTTLVQNGDWEYLNDLITTLSKKHGQLKSSIQAFIQDVIKSLDELNNSHSHELETKIKLIETIRTVTDKKIFVEVERAIVSRQLAEIYLNQKNDLDKAVDILCDLQVETYSLMPFSDKIDYILEQIRLTLQKGDYGQARILTRKILLKSLKNFPKADEYKVEYLKMLIQIDTFEYKYEGIYKNLKLLVEALPEAERASYDDELEIYKTLAHGFESDDLVELKIPESKIFEDEKKVERLKKKVVEHNLKLCSRYYKKIRLDHLAELLKLTKDETETYINEMSLRAKINRPKGIVEFRTSGMDSNELLNDWCYDVAKLVEEVNAVEHLINKEEMLHGIQLRT
ncbi:proteasome regulatory particle subunit [Lodderomyces elongisporus]|uniref:proteasome regulatory particle subunit n=1 Tax=Lodderomyces elongisporus TaxID=36914 RepID=UPI0029219576|nr:proteasome regulatory particle subunit [Lodderomyces elongisporus]WLF81112.1 proteasome regulatory particle subunit [Lodderomyces elongisporus]